MTNAELEKQYETIEPLCDQFGGELTRQLEELLSEKGASLGFPIQYRVKEFNSVAEKIERTAFKAQHIRELHDLIGVRIIEVPPRWWTRGGEPEKEQPPCPRKPNRSEKPTTLSSRNRPCSW